VSKLGRRRKVLICRRAKTIESATGRHVTECDVVERECRCLLERSRRRYEKATATRTLGHSVRAGFWRLIAACQSLRSESQAVMIDMMAALRPMMAPMDIPKSVSDDLGNRGRLLRRLGLLDRIQRRAVGGLRRFRGALLSPFAVQPPSLRAIAELEVGKPSRHDRHDGCVETDDGT
jgi:hypothetical protein